ncbi:MAG: hypothetical protein ACOC4C_03560 [Fibrobacterota bacterium]
MNAIQIYTIGLLLVIGTSLAQSPSEDPLISFDSLDMDSNSFLDHKEFAPCVRQKGEFGNWDTNKDSIIDYNEYSMNFFDLLDKDDNGQLVPEEWETLVTITKKRFLFSSWDTDKNGTVTESEFYSGLRRNDFFTSWDANFNGLDLSEYCRMVFSFTDEDENNRITENEFYSYWGIKKE